MMIIYIVSIRDDSMMFDDLVTGARDKSTINNMFINESIAIAMRWFYNFKFEITNCDVMLDFSFNYNRFV